MTTPKNLTTSTDVGSIKRQLEQQKRKAAKASRKIAKASKIKPGNPGNPGTQYLFLECKELCAHRCRASNGVRVRKCGAQTVLVPQHEDKVHMARLTLGRRTLGSILLRGVHRSRSQDVRAVSMSAERTCRHPRSSGFPS
jgi:hypothetical protein